MLDIVPDVMSDVNSNVKSNFSSNAMKTDFTLISSEYPGDLYLSSISVLMLTVTEDLLVTPFAQILASLRTVRSNYINLTNLPNRYV